MWIHAVDAGKVDYAAACEVVGGAGRRERTMAGAVAPVCSATDAGEHRESAQSRFHVTLAGQGNRSTFRFEALSRPAQTPHRALCVGLQETQLNVRPEIEI